MKIIFENHTHKERWHIQNKRKKYTQTSTTQSKRIQENILKKNKKLLFVVSFLLIVNHRNFVKKIQSHQA